MRANGTELLVCPFNNPESPDYTLGHYGLDVCFYMVNVTNVFIGNRNVSLHWTMQAYTVRTEWLF